MIFGKNINKYYSKYWYLFVLGFFFLIVVDIFQLFIPMIIGQMITALGDDIDSFISMELSFLNGWFKFDLGYVLLVIGIITIVMFVGRIGWRMSLNTISRNVECDMRSEMFAHVEDLSVSWFSKEKVGGLINVTNLRRH